jgi:hypothetical protein
VTEIIIVLSVGVAVAFWSFMSAVVSPRRSEPPPTGKGPRQAEWEARMDNWKQSLPALRG